ncbi:MAG: hypothetical protein HWD62_10520 [Cyclobacteriaceae bacterium]|nr:MAG: hypothetical protein HWD62_10520 [Cyclobacteriaceae bacterium]
MKNNSKAFKIILMLTIAACSWDSSNRKQDIIEFLFNSQWDSLRVYIDDSSLDLERIANSGLQLQNEYDFFINDKTIIIEHEDLDDTITYSWNEETRKISFDTLDLLKLFQREIMIRKFLVENSIKKNEPLKAWIWLNYPERLSIDSLFGTYFKKMYYAVGTEEFGDAIPQIERAWAKGHQDSGLSLSFWYTLTGDREKSIDILKQLASLSNTEAMIKLGDVYETYYKDFGYNPRVMLKLSHHSIGIKKQPI